MNQTNKVYLYSDGSMCRVINENDKTAKQLDPFIVKQKLKLLGSCYEDNGTYCVVNDITRCGSYFSEYYYENEFRVEQIVKKVIPEIVIPEHTVITIGE